jgi:DNA-binding GntR family transcriptional regulator
MAAKGGSRPAPRRERESAPLPDTAYATIRQRILDNAWPPGTQVLEQALALELGMSRTPVREALIRLANEGLVEIVPRHGMRVLPVSPADMQEIYQILTSLEAMAAELVARRRPADGELAPLGKASRDMERALKKEDLDAWAEADERYHRQLVELCGNRRLAGIVYNYWDRAHRSRMFTLRLRPKPVDSTAEHLAVLEAIRRGDAVAARELHRKHRERGSRELLEILNRYRVSQV